MVRSTYPRLRRTGGFFSARAAAVPVASLPGALLAALLALLLLLPAPAAAQQPTRPPRARPDTGRVARDTGRVAPDTGAARAPAGLPRPDTGKAARDTTPPPQLPAFPRPVPAGFATGVWVFTRDSIERFGEATTLADLLEMIPGITPIRSGYFIQPTAASALGQSGGRLRVFLDGYEITPLSGGVPDLSRIELAEVSSIRVERRLDELRIELHSFSPSVPEPYALIQAGVAEPGGKLFRGIIESPNVLFGPFSAGFERLDTDGYRGAEPGDETALWGKWGKIWRGRGGIQAELRHSSVNRQAPAGIDPSSTIGWPGAYNHNDWTIRARWQLLPGLLGEAYYGSSGVNDPRLAWDSTGLAHRFVPNVTIPKLDSTSTRADSLAVQDSLRAAADTVLDRSDRQLGLRLGWLRGPVFADAALRTHSAAFLPGTEGDLALGLARPGLGDVDASAHLESWTGRSATSTRVRGRIGPFQGLSAFGEMASGVRGVPSLVDSAGRPALALFADRSSFRVGADLDRGWISAGIAYLSVKEDSVPSLGLPFDLRPRLLPGGSMTGWESHGRLSLFFKPLSAEYWYVVWTKFQLSADAAAAGFQQPMYVPQQSYRASLVYHQSPLKTGHLEIYARLDARSRGIMYLPLAPTAPVPAINSLDFYLSIRILDLRMFFQETGMTTARGTMNDFPLASGAPDLRFSIPTPRIFYGIRWQFFD